MAAFFRKFFPLEVTLPYFGILFLGVLFHYQKIKLVPLAIETLPAFSGGIFFTCALWCLVLMVIQKSKVTPTEGFLLGFLTISCLFQVAQVGLNKTMGIYPFIQSFFFLALALSFYSGSRKLKYSVVTVSRLRWSLLIAFFVIGLGGLMVYQSSNFQNSQPMIQAGFHWSSLILFCAGGWLFYQNYQAKQSYAFKAMWMGSLSLALCPLTGTPPTGNPGVALLLGLLGSLVMCWGVTAELITSEDKLIQKFQSSDSSSDDFSSAA